MKMFKLILALLCFVIFCECNKLRRDDACYQLELCQSPLAIIQFNYREGMDEQFCQAEATFKNCIEALGTQCNESFHIEEVERMLVAGEFICSNEGSQVIHAAAAQSDCITNATKKSEMETTIRNCKISALTSAFRQGRPASGFVAEESTEEALFCHLVQHYLTCVTNYINENCGAIYGAFLRELIQRTTRPSLRCELFAGHVRRLRDAV
ncbi:unnamed protein product [Lymnaea stagnalis]|uniref:DUF19 domain-containing protein n=1 Tax=Lymnaea stagnalis TaxID=6523 RepID=A0AAV2IHQ0_LYMST